MEQETKAYKNIEVEKEDGEKSGTKIRNEEGGRRWEKRYLKKKKRRNTKEEPDRAISKKNESESRQNQESLISVEYPGRESLPQNQNIKKVVERVERLGLEPRAGRNSLHQAHYPNIPRGILGGCLLLHGAHGVLGRGGGGEPSMLGGRDMAGLANVVKDSTT